MISALRFEWAWQNPDKSKRLKQLVLAKSRKENQLIFKVRIACNMLNSDPWRRLALTFRWMLPEFEVPFPVDVELPPNVCKTYGQIQLTKTFVPTELNQYMNLKNCYICKEKIKNLKHLARCSMTKICGEHFHARCLAEYCLHRSGELDAHLFPIQGHCPNCEVDFHWCEIIKDQRLLLLVEKNKIEYNGMRIADEMIPKEIIKK